MAQGAVRKADGDASDHFVFTFTHDFTTALLMDEIIAILDGSTSAASVAEVSLFRCPVVWRALEAPVLDASSQQRFKVKPAPPRKRAQSKKPSAFERAGDESEDCLEEWLADMLDEDARLFGGLDEHVDGAMDEAAEVDAGELSESGELHDHGDMAAPTEGHVGDPMPTPSLMPPKKLPAATANAEVARRVESTVLNGVSEVQGLIAAMRENVKLSIRAYQDISLVRKPTGETHYVYWTQIVTGKKGRKVSLDKCDRIKTIVAARVPEEDHVDSEVLIPRTGGQE